MKTLVLKLFTLSWVELNKYVLKRFKFGVVWEKLKGKRKALSSSVEKEKCMRKRKEKKKKHEEELNEKEKGKSWE